MASEFGICPVCGAVVPLRSVPWPGVPEAMAEHLKTHESPAPNPTSPPPAPPRPTRRGPAAPRDQ